MTSLASRAQSSLAIRPDASEVRRVAQWLEQSAGNYGIPPDQVERLDLCLQEALANVINHSGTAQNDPLDVRLDVSHRDECHEASVTITDSGRSFDVTQVAEKDLPNSLDQAEPGGLGLILMRSYSDALNYSRRNGLNELTIIVRWQNGRS